MSPHFHILNCSRLASSSSLPLSLSESIFNAQKQTPKKETAQKRHNKASPVELKLKKKRSKRVQHPELLGDAYISWRIVSVGDGELLNRKPQSIHMSQRMDLTGFRPAPSLAHGRERLIRLFIPQIGRQGMATPPTMTWNEVVG